MIDMWAEPTAEIFDGKHEFLNFVFQGYGTRNCLANSWCTQRFETRGKPYLKEDVNKIKLTKQTQKRGGNESFIRRGKIWKHNLLSQQLDSDLRRERSKSIKTRAAITGRTACFSKHALNANKRCRILVCERDDLLLLFAFWSSQENWWAGPLKWSMICFNLYWNLYNLWTKYW